MGKWIFLEIWQILAHCKFKIHFQISKSSCLAYKRICPWDFEKQYWLNPMGGFNQYCFSKSHGQMFKIHFFHVPLAYKRICPWDFEKQYWLNPPIGFNQYCFSKSHGQMFKIHFTVCQNLPDSKKNPFFHLLSKIRPPILLWLETLMVSYLGPFSAWHRSTTFSRTHVMQQRSSSAQKRTAKVTIPGGQTHHKAY